jgi:hypothetical protein
MTNQKGIKRPNRQVVRRLDGLASKLLQYGELDGVELVFIARNVRRNETYSYLSSRDINWLGEIEMMVSLAFPRLHSIICLTGPAIPSQG